MDEIEIIKALAEFATGNKLVLLYIVYSVTRDVTITLWRLGRMMKRFIEAAVRSLTASAEGHHSIASELKALRDALSSKHDPKT